MRGGLRTCLLVGLLAAPALMVACGARTGLGTGGLLDAAVIDAAEEETAEPDASRDADGSPADAPEDAPIDVTEDDALPDAGPPVPMISTNLWGCVVQASGTLKCWGAPSADGGSLLTATAIQGLPGPVVGVTVGDFVVYARMQDDSLQDWGDNYEFAPLGLGYNSGIVSAPTPVPSLGHKFVSAAGTSFHACALLTTGGVACWGSASSGALGNGQTQGLVMSPGPVVGLATKAVGVGTGFSFTCAVLASGAVQCWGAGWAGQLGNGSDADHVLPVTVAGINNAPSVVCGDDHACALLANGAVKCWGEQTYGQLGDGVIATGLEDLYSTVPVDVVGLQSGVAAIAAGHEQSTCALLSSGAVKCWGRNEWGQLGDGTTVSRPTPTDVTGLQSNVISVSIGLRQGCALMSNGGAKCWGSGVLGDPNAPKPSLTPVDVVGLP